MERITRAFAFPGAAAESSAMYWGVPSETYAPSDYGDYLAISNGVYVCSNRRAEYLSSVPLKLYKVSSQGRKDVETGNLRMLLDKVNDSWTFHRLMEMTELSLCLWGSSFWALNRGNSGMQPPRSIWWLRPDRVTVYPGTDTYVTGFTYTPIGGGEDIPFKASEIFWLRKPNPIDEFSGLSPLAAARLAADTANAAQKANMNLFKQGIQLGGIVSPKAGQPMLTDEQGKQLEQQFNKKFTGAENAPKWAIMKLDMQFQSMQMTPKDAEYLGALQWSLEEIARAYGVPLDLVGGQRTYANVQEARSAMWEDTILPELRMIGTELTEQLLPMFPGEADVAEFDVSKVAVLQEPANEAHDRARENFKAGGLTVDRYREIIGEEPLPKGQGDVLMIPSTVIFIRPEDLTAKAEMAMTPPPEPNPVVDNTPPEPSAKGTKSLSTTTTIRIGDTVDADKWGRGIIEFDNRRRAIEFGSAEHERMWRAFTSATAPYEKFIADVVKRLFQNQRKSVLARVAENIARAVAEPFDRARWTRTFREGVRPPLVEIVRDAGTVAMDSLNVGLSFNVKSPEAIRFLEGRAQRFATQVNDTTWTNLKSSLSEGFDAGETIPELAARVEAVMGDRIASSSTTIARTETIGAYNGGSQVAWEQSGVVAGKEWVAALDERTRNTHSDAHGQQVGLHEDFHVGDGSGPAPGQIGLPEEDCNCRCTAVAILTEDWQG